MADGIAPVRVNHMNIVMEDFDESVQHFKNLFDAEFVVDLPSPAFHACLVAMGGGIIELFVPEAYLLSARYGPFHLGVEYQADMDVVRQVIADQNIRIIRDIGVALHTHPDDTLGVSFEFYSLGFHEKEWPLLGRPILPVDHWTKNHALGMTGLKGYSIVVADIDAGLAFLRGFFATETVYDETRPALNARAIGLQVSDTVIELLAPLGAGELEDYLKRAGPGIRSTLFNVADLDVARAYFKGRGVDVLPGSTPDRILVPEKANRGLLFEFGT